MSVIFRLIAPLWSKPTVSGKENPEFREEIKGPSILEGDFDKKFIQAKNKEGYSIYFFPNFPTPYASVQGKWINGKDINTFGLAYVDMDLKDGVYASKEAFVAKLHENPKLAPYRIIDSGNGIHAYWEVSNFKGHQDFMEIQHRLIAHFKTDDSVWTAHHVMRFPGTINTKKFGEPVECKTLEKVAKIYTVEELSAQLSAITPEAERKVIDHLDKLFGAPKEVLHDSGEIPDKFVKLVESDMWVKTLFERPREFAGDRSKADMSLCNILYNKSFTREEAYNVLLNTEKALSRQGRDRGRYAQSLIDKVYTDRPTAVALSVSELQNMPVIGLGDRVWGPNFMDCTESGWRRKQVLGLVAPPGCGKTTTSLKIVRDCIANTPNSDEIFIYFSLEMTSGEIIERWHTLTGGNTDFDKRFFVVSNETVSGESLHINLQDIYRYTFDTANKTGKRVAGIIIDHINIINMTVDIRNKPTLGVINPTGNPHRYKIKIELPDVCEKLKELAKRLDCFLLIQSQTTKSKAGNGDQALGMDAAFGTARFEWFCDYVVTCWQPLRPLYDEISLRVMAWKYEKIRKASDKDLVRVGVPHFLTFDMKTGDMRPQSEDEFQYALGKMKELKDRKKKEQNGEYTVSYKNSPTRTLRDLQRFEVVTNADPKQNRNQ